MQSVGRMKDEEEEGVLETPHSTGGAVNVELSTRGRGMAFSVI